MAEIVPTAADMIGDDLLAISWSDGRTLHYPLAHLRARCPCAQCSPEPGRARPDPETFAGIGLKRLKQVGAYALRIGFTDGHDLGIYPFTRLREIGFAPGTEPVVKPPPPPKAPASFEV